MSRAEPAAQIASFVREHAVWCLGLLPFVVATINIVVLSGGKPQVFGYLVKNLDIVGLILSSCVPLISVICLWATSVWLSTDSNWRSKSRSDIESMLYIFALFGFLISLMTTQLTYLMVMAFSFAVHGYRYMRARCRNRLVKDTFGVRYLVTPLPRYGYAHLIASLGLICFISILFLPPTWLPTENIEVRNTAPFSGQMIALDGEWTMLLRSTGNVQIVHTADMESRVPCEDSQFLLGRSTAEMLARSANRMRVPVCKPG
jgi:hypothetical protein